MAPLDAIRDRSHLILGTIRLVNGLAALLAPGMSARRIGTDPDADPAPIYPLRMFGVRTVVLGAELLTRRDPDARRRAMQVGVLIHGSDTIAAVLGGVRGQLPRRVAMLLTGVSTLNTVLAVLGSLPPRRRLRSRISLPRLR